MTNIELFYVPGLWLSTLVSFGGVSFYYNLVHHLLSTLYLASWCCISLILFDLVLRDGLRTYPWLA